MKLYQRGDFLVGEGVEAINLPLLDGTRFLGTILEQDCSYQGEALNVPTAF